MIIGDSMDGQVILLFGTLLVGAVIAVAIVLNIIQARKLKKYKQKLEQLEIEKNILDSSPVIPELSKVENISKNEKLEAMYDNWSKRLNDIRSEQVPKITDMLLEADHSLSKMDYKSTLYKIARLEMEIYKVRTNSEFLLNEIKDITSSEERNRALITGLKATYRKLYEKFNQSRHEYQNVAEVIDLQFANIAKRFEDFEVIMENNEYTEVGVVVKNIDEMLRHMTNVIEEIPNILLLATQVLPKKISEVETEYQMMVEKGYPLDYLNVEYNVSEAKQKIVDILEKSKALNLQDSLLELKVLVDYFEGVLTDFDKEKVNKKRYEESNKVFRQKYEKISSILRQVFKQIDEIRRLYNLSDEDIQELKNVSNELEGLCEDYKVLIDHTSNNTFAFSKLTKEIDQLTLRLAKLDERVDAILDSIGSMKEDEVRARQQLEEVKTILKDSRAKIREYNLPVIPQSYYIELKDARAAIKEIVKELDKKPITIEVLNTRVDTARDLVLKLYNTTREMLRTAMFAEMAIVYGNRYRAQTEDLDKYLTYAEKLFHSGDYQKSLEVSINSLNRIENGIYDKLLKLYSKEV